MLTGDQHGAGKSACTTMSDMQTQSVGKRAACDRCHALKMRCVVIEEGPADVAGSRGLDRGHRRCNRCHSARVTCNYSSPGKPGRPPTKTALGSTGPHTGIRQPPVGGPEALTWQSPRRQSMSVTTTSTLVSTNQDNVPTSNPFDFGALPPGAGHPKSPQPTSWCDTLALPGDNDSLEELEQYSRPMLSWNLDTADYSAAPGRDHWAGEQQESQRKYEDIICFPISVEAEFEVNSQDQHHLDHATASEKRTSEALSGQSASTTSISHIAYDGPYYLQQLSEFNTRLSSPILGVNDPNRNLDQGASTTVSQQLQASVITTDQLEQAATHVLQSSALFLDLVQFPSSLPAADDRDTSTPARPVVPDMAARLQLVVSYMRLTELHHGLYSAVYSHLHQQQQHQETGTSTTCSAEQPTERLPQFSLSVAGVSLTAMRAHPRFQLQLLLQTSAHYLGCIQEELDLPTPLRVSGLTQRSMSHKSAGRRERISPLGQRGSAEAALLVHTLMMHDQEPKLQRISDVLESLRRDFGIVVIYGTT